MVINLIKEVKDLYNENCKAMIKEIEKVQINAKALHTRGSEWWKALKYPYYPNNPH